jgi:hypothetical protein
MRARRPKHQTAPSTRPRARAARQAAQDRRGRGRPRARRPLLGAYDDIPHHPHRLGEENAPAQRGARSDALFSCDNEHKRHRSLAGQTERVDDCRCARPPKEGPQTRASRQYLPNLHALFADVPTFVVTAVNARAKPAPPRYLFPSRTTQFNDSRYCAWLGRPGVTIAALLRKGSETREERKSTIPH